MMKLHLKNSKGKGCCLFAIETPTTPIKNRKELALFVRTSSADQRQLLESLCSLDEEQFTFIDNSLQIVIYSKQLYALLKLLAISDALYFEGKRCICDLFTKTWWELVIEPHNDKGTTPSSTTSLQLTLWLTCRFGRIAPSTLPLFIPSSPPCYVEKGVLRLAPPLKSSVFDSSLLPLFLPPSSSTYVILNSSLAKAILELTEEEDEEIKVIFKECHPSDLLQATPEPVPLLQLGDRSGAFANLMMRYGDDIYPFERNNRSTRKERNLESERQWEADLLETDFIYKPTGKTDYYCPLPHVNKSLTFLIEIGWQIKDWQNRTIVALKESLFEIEEAQASLRLRGTLDYGAWRCDLVECQGSFVRQERFFNLDAGHVALLPEKIAGEEVKFLFEGAEIIEVEGQKAEGTNRFLALPKSRLGQLAHLEGQTNLNERLKRLLDELRSEEKEPSSAFCAKLRPYQKRGLAWLWRLHESGLHGLLADDMGLGKTVQLLALISCLHQEGIKAAHLIVVPTSLLFNWAAEVKRFLPHLRVYMHYGPQRHTAPELIGDYELVITSYTVVRKDIDLLQSIDWHLLACDEAQNIKNAQTQTSQALCSLKAVFRLSISGTPIENHLTELWSHFHFLLPELLGEQKDFLQKISAAAADPSYLKRLKKRIHPFILRRTKAEAAPELPTRGEQSVWIEMGQEQRVLYDNFIAKAQSNLLKKVRSEGVGKHRMQIFELLLRLRQLCCHPLLLSSFDEQASLVGSAKYNLLVDELKQVADEGGKVLFYSQFTSFLKLIAQELNRSGLSYLYLDGTTKDRQDLVDRFQADEKMPIFLISLKAGGVGLNLTAADYVFIAEPWWNDAVEQQAIDRAHRIGRTKPLLAKRYLVRSSIEEKIDQLKKAKSRLSEELIDDEADGLSLTNQQLEELLFF